MNKHEVGEGRIDGAILIEGNKFSLKIESRPPVLEKREKAAKPDSVALIRKKEHQRKDATNGQKEGERRPFLT